MSGNRYSRQKKLAHRRGIYRLPPTKTAYRANPADLCEAQLIHESDCEVWANGTCSCRPRIEWVRFDDEPLDIEVAP